jgi:hypothetical protein
MESAYPCNIHLLMTFICEIKVIWSVVIAPKWHVMGLYWKWNEEQLNSYGY